MSEKRKTNKQFFFISGLPRSGSTLLCNILAQNPRFHVTSTSGIVGVIIQTRNSWDKNPPFRAAPDPNAKERVLRGILENYHAGTDKPVVFDKSRAWPAYVELLENILGEKPKFLITVRDVRDVLASFERIWRDNAKNRQISQEELNQVRFQTVEGRVSVWLDADNVVGEAFNIMTDALKRGHGPQMFFVDFDDLTTQPERTIKAIYDFLGEQYFKHDFNNVKQVTQEDDSFYGFNDLHTIRPKVEPVESKWREVLGPFAEKFGGMNFWKNKM